MTSVPAVAVPPLIVDGMSLLYRGVMATLAQGHPYASVPYFTRVLADNATHGRRIAVVWDAGNSLAYRRGLWPEYKKHRDRERIANPMAKQAWEDVGKLREQLQQFLPALGVEQAWALGWEGDDIAYDLIFRRAWNGATIISTDADLMQMLVPRGSAYLGAYAYHDLAGPTWTAERFTEFRGFPPQRLAEFKSLVGDKSDNVPGLKGIGEGRAKKLIQHYPDLVQMILAAQNENNPPKWLAHGGYDTLRHRDAAAHLERNMRLISLAAAPPPNERLVYVPAKLDIDLVKATGQRWAVDPWALLTVAERLGH